jgi:hypothetical protein
LIYNLGESRRIIDSHLRKLLPIQRNICLLQTIDELAVPQPVLLASSVDSDNPQPPELSPLDATVAVGKCTGSKQRFLSRSEQLAATSNVSFGSLQQSLS